MAIYSNTSSINGIYVGSERCIQAYIGSTLCWEAPKSYGDITVFIVGYLDIPNTGGTVNPSINFRQTWGYYSDTSGGGLVRQPESVSYSVISFPTGWTLNQTTGAITATSGNIAGKTGKVSITATSHGKTVSKTVTVTQKGVALEPIDQEFTVDPTSLSFGYSSDTSIVTVTCPTGSTWTASANSSWITISPTSGSAGTTQVMVGVTTNSISSSRSGRVSFSCTDSSSSDLSSIISLSVSQSPSGTVGSIEAPLAATLGSSVLTKTITISLSDGASLSSSNPIVYMQTVCDWLGVSVSYSGGKALVTLSVERSLYADETNQATITWTKNGYANAITIITYS